MQLNWYIFNDKWCADRVYENNPTRVGILSEWATQVACYPSILFSINDLIKFIKVHRIIVV
jgi:hypothetical protein